MLKKSTGQTKFSMRKTFIGCWREQGKTNKNELVLFVYPPDWE
jgi:hypothetical protein